MPRRSRTKASAASREAAAAANAKDKPAARRVFTRLFDRCAYVTAHWTGKPVTFLAAIALVVIWAATGPLFNYSDTWQLVINTSTTIVTFLMVFLIQATQNRDTLALQLKLSELILAISTAENRIAAAEDLSEEELEQLHQDLRKRADDTLGTLNARRAGRKRAS
jgi:low affinity Fe/Cu permease